MSDDYIPIDCDIHERYELAIMHGISLFIRWRDPGGMTHLEVLRPVDLRARDGEEFLYTRTADGGERVLRLDSILDARDQA